MSNVIPFPMPLARVEIDGGIITGASDPALIGTFRYYATHVEHDGSRLCIWDGPHADDAIREARIWAKDFGIPVLDTVRR